MQINDVKMRTDTKSALKIDASPKTLRSTARRNRCKVSSPASKHSTESGKKTGKSTTKAPGTKSAASPEKQSVIVLNRIDSHQKTTLVRNHQKDITKNVISAPKSLHKLESKSPSTPKKDCRILLNKLDNIKSSIEAPQKLNKKTRSQANNSSRNPDDRKKIVANKNTTPPRQSSRTAQNKDNPSVKRVGKQSANSCVVKTYNKDKNKANEECKASRNDIPKKCKDTEKKVEAKAQDESQTRRRSIRSSKKLAILNEEFPFQNRKKIEMKTDTDQTRRQSLRSKKKPKKFVDFESSITKETLSDKKITTIKKKKPKLRNRNFINYAESSLEVSSTKKVETKPENVNKVPVYKQQLNRDSNLNKPKDLYEFDSDSDNNKKRIRKRRKQDSSCSDLSDEYNKTIAYILKNVMHKVKKKPKKNRIVTKKETIGKVSKKPVVQGRQKLPVRIMDGRDVVNNNFDLKSNKAESVIDDDPGHDNFQCNDNPNINIISDVKVKPNQQIIGTPSNFQERRPNANSTMQGNVLTPWRFNDINITRNPHFITIKRSSLPSINQEMVLDHRIVDKFNDTTRNDYTPEEMEISHQKRVVQKTLHEFYGNDKENQENPHEISLFDEQLFSPIKGTNQFATKVNMVKRRILGDKDVNERNTQMSVSTPKTVSVSPIKQKSKDISYFGFDSTGEEMVVSPTKAKDARPFRVSINANDKKYQSKRKRRLPKSPSYEINEEMEEEGDSEVSDDEEEQMQELGLFEDFHESPKERKIKKTKTLWLNDDDHRHKRRKDARTKEEEEEAEKWATAFNSMCEEIEHFPLEIE